MAYKLEGNLSDPARIYVVDPVQHTVLLSQDFPAGPYLFEGIPTEEVHTFAVTADGQLNGYGNVSGIPYTYYPTSFGLQLVSIYNYQAGTYHNMTWSWDGDDFYTLSSPDGDNNSSHMHAFFSCPKDALHGHRLLMDSQVTFYGETTTGWLRILDGKYDRNSGIDFNFVKGGIYNTKGAGILYDYHYIHGPYPSNSTIARFTMDTGILNLNAATFDDVTVLLFLQDNSTGGNNVIYHHLYDLIIKNGSTGETLSYMAKTTSQPSVAGAEYRIGTWGPWNAWYPGT